MPDEYCEAIRSSKHRTLYVNLVAGYPRLGIWCEMCRLPSAYEIDVHAMVGDSPPCLLKTLTRCTECDDDDA